MGTYTDTAERVFELLKRNQRQLCEEENYVARVSDELGLARKTVIAAVDHLERLGVVERQRHGAVKLLVVKDEVI